MSEDRNEQIRMHLQGNSSTVQSRWNVLSWLCSHSLFTKSEHDAQTASHALQDKLDDNFYEVLPSISDSTNDSLLLPSFTPTEGIRISVYNQVGDEDAQWNNFRFTEEQAEHVGQALVRWAQRSRALKSLRQTG